MPPITLDKHQTWAVHLLRDFFTALRKGEPWDFLRSAELQRFLHGPVGSVGTAVPEGTPGSKFPRAGGGDILDALQALFDGFTSGLGEIDRATSGDPAAAGTGPEPRINVETSPDGTISTVIVYADGSSELWVLEPNGRYSSETRDINGRYHVIIVSPGPAEGDCRVEIGHREPGQPFYATLVHWYSRDGAHSPGEGGGGDANSDRNPLHRLEVVGPGSIQQMVQQMRHPPSDPGKLDPNTGQSGIEVGKEEREQLGRIAPALEVLDPNSGVDPLSQLSLDPNQLHTRGEKDDRVDPNTGLKPGPVGG